MKKLILPILLVICHFSVFAQFSGAVASYKLVSGNDWVKAKNYYFLTLLEQDKEAKALLISDPELSKLTQTKVKSLQESLANCKEALCLPAQLKFTPQEIELISNRLSALYQKNNALDRLVQNHLIPSGCYILNQPASPAELMVKAWQQDAAAINHAIGVYAEGKKPNYPAIDSISFNTKAKAYYILMYDCSAEVADNITTTSLFFEPALQAALVYLEINERRDAANFEPMATTANKAAVDRVKLIKWPAYPYSHILVPGAGPEDINTPLSGEGMLRCKAAAKQYKLGKAPYIVVSGGNVHPFKTKYNEAVEMRAYLVNNLHIPGNVVMIEPHARHTTTNVRNDARMIFRYGIPFSKPALIVTDKFQNNSIENMAGRCERELGYVPYKLGKRLSDTALEFHPLIQALQIDADEPMDP